MRLCASPAGTKAMKISDDMRASGASGKVCRKTAAILRRKSSPPSAPYVALYCLKFVRLKYASASLP